MKHAIILFLTILTLTSCAVTQYTYGDIAVMDNNGQTIRQWDNCIMDTDIKDGGSLIFVDAAGETHYVSGGVIIVDNIYTETIVNNPTLSTKSTKPTIDVDELVAESKQLRNLIKEKQDYLHSHKSSMTPSEIQELNEEIKILKADKSEIENRLRSRWY